MKTFKRTLSCFLALLMIFGSFSVLSYAKLGDNNQNSIEIYTKFFVGDEEVTEVKTGDTVKARVYIATDFMMATTTLFWVYPLDFLKFDKTGLSSQGVFDHGGEGFDITGVLNTSETSTPGSAGLAGFMVHQEGFILDSMSDADNLVYEGYLSEDYFDDKGWISLTINKGTPVVATTDEWFFEFSFTVLDTATADDKGFFYIPEESVMNTTGQDYGFTAVQRAISDTKFDVNVSEQAYMMAYDLQLKDKNTIKLGSGEVTPTTYKVTYSFANTAPEGAGEVPEEGTVEANGTIAAPTVTAPAGWTITWEAKSGATKNADGSFTAAESDVEIVGTWAKTEYDVTYSFTNEAPNGITAPAAGKTTVGATINPGITAPAGYTLTWAVTGATDNGNGTYTAGANNVTFAGTWAKVDYDVTYSFTNEAPNGITAPAAGKTTVGATINPGITAPAGYTLTWAVTGATDNGNGTYTAGANNVTFAGTWAKVDYDVTYSFTNEAPNGITAPAAGKTTVGATINPGITAPAGYTLTWAVTGATDNGNGTYTAGANNVTFAGTWAKVDYDVTYSFTNEAPNGITAPAAGKTTVGATINPGITAPAGYTLTWAVTGATDNGNGTYTAGANNVTFVGTWATVEYDVTYSFTNEAPNGITAPAAGKTTVGATINPGITAPDGYTLTWAVTGATDNDNGTYTAGANNVTFVGTWAKKSYTITYYLSEEDKAAGKVYDTQTVAFGDSITAIENPTSVGQVFEAWDIDFPAAMPAENLEAVAIFTDIVVTFYDIFGDPIASYEKVTEITEDQIPSEDDATLGEDVNFVEWQIDGAAFETPYALEGSVDVYPYCEVEIIYYVDENLEDVYKTYTFAYGHDITADDLADLGTPVKTGYHLDEDMPWDWDFVGETATMNSYTFAYWIPNEYTATFTAGEGKFADGAETKAVEGVEFDSTFTFDTYPVLEGYTCVGWTDVEGSTEALDELVMDAENKTFYPVFVKNGSAEFFIELYLMNTEGKYDATASKTLTESGVIGINATADHGGCQQYVDDWFSADTSEEVGNVYEGVIAEDGSTILKLYYKRAQYDVVIDGAEAVKVYHGAKITAPATAKDIPADKHLASWNNGAYAIGEEIEVTGALTLTPDIEVNADAEYTVEIYLMGTDGKYAEAIEKTEKAPFGSTVTVAHADYAQEAWFSADTAEANKYTDVVAEDGSTVLKLYYARAQYDVVIDGAEAVKVYHGATVTAPETAKETPAGYVLESWNDGAYAKGEVITVTGPLTLAPKFAAGTSTYTIKTYTMDTEGNYGEAVVTTDTYTTDETVTYTAPVIENFTADKESYSVKVTGDGNAVIEVYYIRNQYDVVIDGAEAVKVYHGATVTAPETAKETPAGYVLESWNDGAYAKGEVITVTGPLTLAPKFAAGTSTYTIKTYTMDTEGNYGEAVVTTDTYTTDETVTYTAPVIEGLTADKESYSVKVTGDGNAVIEVRYTRAQYDVTIDGVTTPVYHGAKVTAPTESANTPAGNTLASWNNGAYAKGEVITVTGPLTLTPDFTANEDTAYKVEIYLQDENGNYAETASKVEDETGKTGEIITIAHTDYAQESYYLADDAQANEFTGTIAGDGSLTLKLYFKRATYDVIVDGEVVAEDVIHGAEITLPETSDNITEGNDLAGWTDGKNTYEPGETIVVDGALDLQPVEKPSNSIKYTISINVMDVDGKSYITTETQAFGTTGTTQTIVADYSREGFTVNTEKSNLTDTIKGDGTTVLSVFYDRNLYTATFDGVDYPVYFGAALPVVEPAAQEGKEFDKWTPEVPAVMPAENLEFTPTWNTVKYKLIYIINGEKEVYEYAVGATVTPRENPSVPGMTFTGWNGTIPTVMPAEDVIIVAKFEAAVFKVTFLDATGNVFDEKAVKCGDEIIVPATNPTKDYNVFKGWEGIPADGIMPDRDLTIRPIFERVPVRLVAVDDTITTIDRETMIITGLTTKFNDAKADKFLAIEGDGYYVLTEAENFADSGFYGTGAKVEVYDNADTSAPIEVFYIVIYGDVNGDSAVNSLDGSLVNDEVLWVTSWSRNATKDALKVMAADLNKDGKITTTDADNIENTALGVTKIDQTTGTVTR